MLLYLWTLQDFFGNDFERLVLRNKAKLSTKSPVFLLLKLFSPAAHEITRSFVLNKKIHRHFQPGNHLPLDEEGANRVEDVVIFLGEETFLLKEIRDFWENDGRVSVHGPKEIFLMGYHRDDLFIVFPNFRIIKYG